MIEVDKNYKKFINSYFQIELVGVDQTTPSKEQLSESNVPVLNEEILSSSLNKTEREKRGCTKGSCNVDVDIDFGGLFKFPG